MKGRFRKGKKAYRGKLKSPRQSRLEGRYQAWLLRKERRRRNAVRMAQAALIAGSGAMALALIQSTPGRSVHERAIAVAGQVINTAQAISKVFNE